MDMLQVQGGDAIDIKAYAKYNSGGAKSNVGVDGIVSGLVNAFGFNPNSSESGVVLDLFEQANGALGALVAGTGNSDVPEAYLQYLFFDKDFNFVNTVDVGYAYDKVGSAAAVDPNSPVGDHEELHLTRTFTEDGYIFIFVSNSSTGIDVFFDDLTIDYTMNPIDQANDYYPFGGLMGSGFERIISKANDFRYQGKEYDKDLQWYDFHARQYDPYLGRFLAADPLMQFSSPYNGMGNNPLNLIDPTGMSARGTRLDGIAEEDDDQDDEVNAVSNGTTADEWERQKAAHYAQFINWLGGMNSTYGHSLHAANTYGMGNGSFGSAGHYQYAKNHGAQTVNYYNKNAVNNYNGAPILPEMTSTTRRDPFNAPGQQNSTGIDDSVNPLQIAWGVNGVFQMGTDIAVNGAKPRYTGPGDWTKMTKLGSKFGTRLGVVGIALTVVDVSIQGEWKNHHKADIIISTGLTIGAMIPGVNVGVAILGGIYFITDLGVQISTKQSITEHLFDSTPTNVLVKPN